MANTTYRSAQITNQIQRRIAYDDTINLLQHIREATGAYAISIDIVSLDFGITAANRITLITSNPIPDLADRFPNGRLTQVSP